MNLAIAANVGSATIPMNTSRIAMPIIYIASDGGKASVVGGLG
jgi:hypothetical protein